jgi:short-subunit dehydrogenase
MGFSNMKTHLLTVLCVCGFMAENQRSTYGVSKNALHEMHGIIAGLTV